jgi:hypothetical protein
MVAVTERRDVTEKRERGRIARTLAKTDKQLMAQAFGTTKNEARP